MRHHKLFWGSSYDRGLDIVLRMWPDIKAKYPEATLDICYGWGLFEGRYQNNPERMNWKKNMDEMMSAKGITHHGRVGKKQLADIRSQCGIWFYPTYFPEINCITALDAQHDGLVPVVINYAALDETVGSGIKVKGDIYMLDTRNEIKDRLLDLMGDEKYWSIESKKAKEFAKDFTWDKIAAQWAEVFNES